MHLARTEGDNVKSRQDIEVDYEWGARSKRWASCPKCKSGKVHHDITLPWMELHPSGVIVMHRAHECVECGMRWMGDGEPGDKTEVLRWLCYATSLTPDYSGITVTIAHGGKGTLATVQMQPNRWLDGVVYKLSNGRRGQAVYGEVPTDDASSEDPWEVLRRVIRHAQDQKADNGNEETDDGGVS